MSEIPGMNTEETKRDKRRNREKLRVRDGDRKIKTIHNVQLKCILFSQVFIKGRMRQSILQLHQKINKSLTLNQHGTQCHWPHTLQWGCSVGLCILIHCCTKSFPSYPKMILKICVLCCTKSWVNHLLT